MTGSDSGKATSEAPGDHVDHDLRLVRAGRLGGDRMNIDKVAQAIFDASHPSSKGFIPRSVELQYRRMAQAAIDALGLTEECRLHTCRYAGTYGQCLGCLGVRRWVSAWEGQP